MIQPRNGYHQYCSAVDSTFFEAKLTSARGRDQLVEVKDEAEILDSRSA